MAEKMLTETQSAMLVRTRAAAFGQLRQQHLTDVEHRVCVSLVTLGLMKDIAGTTFMLTDAGCRP